MEVLFYASLVFLLLLMSYQTLLKSVIFFILSVLLLLPPLDKWVGLFFALLYLGGLFILIIYVSGFSFRKQVPASVWGLPVLLGGAAALNSKGAEPLFWLVVGKEALGWMAIFLFVLLLFFGATSFLLPPGLPARVGA